MKMRYIWAIVTSIVILMVFTVIKVFYSTMIDIYQKEHINELSKEIYVALGVSEIIPLIIAIILIRIVWKKITYKEQVEINSNLKNNSLESNDTINNSNTSLSKAVYNHTKDIASEIKPTINEYKEKHQISKTDTSNFSSINEDEIYEKVMLEIEEDNKVKSTWARALAQSEGDRDKAESFYIKLRFNEIKDDNIINGSVVDIVTSTKKQDYNNEEFKINSNEKTNNNLNKKILFVILFIIIISIIPVIMTKFEKKSSSNYSLENQNNEKSIPDLVEKDKILSMYHNGKYGFINEDGTWIIKPIYDAVSSFSEGLAKVLINEKIGFIDKKGNLIIQPIYSIFSENFTEGLAKVEINEKYGFIDKQGNLVIQPVYDFVSSFSEGLAKVLINEKIGFIDKKGNLIIQPIYSIFSESFTEGLAKVEINGKYGFIDKQGNLVIQPVYDFVRSFSDGLVSVKINEKYGFIDKEGNLVIQPIYDTAVSFSDGLARVKFGKYSIEKNGFNDIRKSGFIDKEGNLVIQPVYDMAESFSDGLASVKINGKYGFIDKEGNLVIQPVYDFVRSFSDGLAIVSLNSNKVFYYINKKGEVVVTPKSVL